MTGGPGVESPSSHAAVPNDRSAVRRPPDPVTAHPLATTLDLARDVPFEERNWLLRFLTEDEYATVAPHLERVPLAAGQRLASPAGGTAHVYFPQSGAVSILRRLRDGSDVEVGTIGAEGMTAATALPGDEPACECLVQVEGVAHRIPAGVLRALAREHGPLHAIVQRFSQYLFNLAAQSVVCARRHRIEQQCARWLLTMHDRVAGDEVVLTHDRVATVLDVRRASVSDAFAELQRIGAIDTGRGRVTVTNREALEARSCECYHALRDDFASLLGPLHRHAAST